MSQLFKASLFAVVTCLTGCSSSGEENVPPVMSALNNMEEMQAQSAAAAESQNAFSPDESTDVPLTGTFQVKFETSKGNFIVEVNREWAPIGADQFEKLVRSGFYDDCRIFRAISGFMVQFGIAGDPKVQAKWRKNLKDDPVKKSNQRGFITYAKTGLPNSRTTQVFINYGDNANLDDMGFAPFGRVIEGMDVVDSFYSGYGESASGAQQTIQEQGNAFLDRQFPKLDRIIKATIVEPEQQN